MSLHFTNYSFEYIKLCFTEDRWNELEIIINEWIPATDSKGNTYKELWVNPQTMKTMFNAEHPSKSTHSFDYQRKLVLQELLTEEETEKINNDAMRLHREKFTKERFEKGTKIPVSEYDSPIFCQDGDYYFTVDEYLENCEENEIEPQEWVYGSSEHFTLDEWGLHGAIEYVSENVEVDDWEPDFGPPDYLVEAWKRYVEEYREKYYMVDYKKIIVL